MIPRIYFHLPSIATIIFVVVVFLIFSVLPESSDVEEMSQREEDRQYYNETIIDPMSSDFAQDGLLSQVINSEELKEILTNFKSEL